MKHAEWSARGAGFLTEPKVHGSEIRAYICDPLAAQARAAWVERLEPRSGTF